VRPETALPGTTSGERRRAAQLYVTPVRVWDPDGPTTAAIAPALWEALRDAVLWAQAEWERVIEHAAGSEEATAHLAQLCLAVRQQACGQEPSGSTVPRNPLSRRLLALVRGAFEYQGQKCSAASLRQKT